MDKLPNELKQPLVELLLSVADDKFILGHRNADWTGLAPILEEDIAFSSLSQDEISHAIAIYQIAAGLVGSTADKLAYARKPDEYLCAELVELSDEFNWAIAVCRNFFCDHHDYLRLGRLAHSSYVPLAQLAGRLVAEEQIHVQHVDMLLKRLGHGDTESRERMQSALDRLAPLATGLLEPTQGIELLEAKGVYPRIEPAMFERWTEDLRHVAEASELKLQLQAPRAEAIGGRRGRHSDAFASLLDELTEVYRLEPEAAW
ncbi:MAG: phenylacetate-CoA oxygenase subunit PaaC [Planctomycetes bacterium]|nr:phenylacetate-CoA oxygenase subunit PaaC [Planctomycetota bacterium]